MENFRVKRYRDERIYIPSQTSSFVRLTKGNGLTETGRLHNISRFGAKVSFGGSGLGDDIETRTSYSSILISIAGSTVFEGPCLVVNVYEDSDNCYSYGVHFSEGQVSLDGIRAALDTAGVPDRLLSVRSFVDSFSEVEHEFKCLVSDLTALYQDIKNTLNKEEDRIKLQSNRSKSYIATLEENTIQICLSLYANDIHSIFGKFDAIVSGLDFERLQLHKRYFRTCIHPVTLGSGFIARAFSKPLGYAGDFGLMLMLYDYKDIGSNLFERFFHRFSCNEPAAIANKNRIELISQFALEKLNNCGDRNFKITSIACGPAREIELISESAPENTHLEFILLDQERLALDYCKERLHKFEISRGFNYVYLKEDAVLGFLKRQRFLSEISGSDLIVSAGLFDYLSDKISLRLISEFFHLLKPGGTLLIGNVSKKNPDRFSMEFFMEWNLILRNEVDLINLVDSRIKSSAAEIDVVSESLGLNLFLKIKKPV